MIAKESSIYKKKKKKGKNQKQWTQKTNSKPKLLDFIFINKSMKTIQWSCTFMTEQHVN